MCLFTELEMWMYPQRARCIDQTGSTIIGMLIIAQGFQLTECVMRYRVQKFWINRDGSNGIMGRVNQSHFHPQPDKCIFHNSSSNLGEIIVSKPVIKGISGQMAQMPLILIVKGNRSHVQCQSKFVKICLVQLCTVMTPTKICDGRMEPAMDCTLTQLAHHMNLLWLLVALHKTNELPYSMSSGYFRWINVTR